jgi:hypothetical protein
MPPEEHHKTAYRLPLALSFSQCRHGLVKGPTRQGRLRRRRLPRRGRVRGSPRWRGLANGRILVILLIRSLPNPRREVGLRLPQVPAL